MSARQKYLNQALRLDTELASELQAIKQEVARICNGTINSALLGDENFKKILSRRSALEKFPITERDFSDLVFYDTSTLDLVPFQIDLEHVETDEQIGITVPIDIDKKTFDLIWKYIKPHTRKSKSKGSERFDLVYAVQKAKLNGMGMSTIIEKLRQGKLDLLNKEIDITDAELRTILHRADKSISLKDAT